MKPDQSTFFQLIFLLIIFPFHRCNTLADQNFLQCLSAESDTVSKVIYTQSDSRYPSILKSKIQNLIFSTPSNPKPVFIITPFRVSEIQAAVKCSREHGLQIRTRSGGHDQEGLSSISDVPFIIVDLINFSEVSVDVEERTAWVESGATLGKLNYVIGKKNRNLAYPVGTCPDVGAGGHFSGGGYGGLMRKYGTAADHVIDAHLIDAKGRILNRESMGEDLFWAIRGGGGASFGIIVSWKINLVTVPSTVTVFAVPRTLEQNATKLLHKWQHVAHRVDEDLFISPFLYRVNSTMVVMFRSLFLGDSDRLLRLMQESFPELGLTKQDCREVTFLESILYLYEFEVTESLDVDVLLHESFRKRFFKGKADYVTEPVPEEAFPGLYDIFFQELDPTTFGVLAFFPHGGRMNDIPASEISFPHRAGNIYSLFYHVEWGEDASDGAFQRHYNLLTKLYDYMTPYVSANPRAAFLNYRDLDLGTNNRNGPTSVEEAGAWGKKYFKNNFYRLVEVKTMVDPQNFFSNEQSIPPLNFLKDEL